MVNNRKLRILFVCDDNLRDSVVYDVHLLAETVSILGHKVTIVSSSRGRRTCPQVTRSVMSRVYGDSTAVLYQFPYLAVPGLNWLFGLFASGALIRRLLRMEDIDVIVMYSVLFTGVPTLLIAKSLGIPTVFRNIDMLYKLQTNYLKKTLVRMLECYVYKRVQRVLALTEEYRRYLIDLGAPKRNIAILPFPVSTDFFSEAKGTAELRKCWGISERDFVAVYIGRLYTFSMLADILRAIPESLTVIPNLKLVIVGSGPILQELRTVRGSLGLESHVVLTGLQPFDLLPGFLDLADVCINAYALPDNMEDVFSAKVLQYMAAAKPIISINQQGMVKSLENSEHGVVFVESVSAMMRGIYNLAHAPAKRHLLAEKNRQFVQRLHDIGVIAQALEEELFATCSRTAAI